MQCDGSLPASLVSLRGFTGVLEMYQPVGGASGTPVCNADSLVSTRIFPLDKCTRTEETQAEIGTHSGGQLSLTQYEAADCSDAGSIKRSTTAPYGACAVVIEDQDLTGRAVDVSSSRTFGEVLHILLS